MPFLLRNPVLLHGICCTPLSKTSPQLYLTDDVRGIQGVKSEQSFFCRQTFSGLAEGYAGRPQASRSSWWLWLSVPVVREKRPEGIS
jgi:hypothetical protein